MVTRPLDAGHVRDTATSDLDRGVNENAVDPSHRVDRAVRVLAPTRRNRKRVGITAGERAPGRPIGLLIDVASNDDRRTARRGTRHDFVNVPTPLIAIEIEVDAAE